MKHQFCQGCVTGERHECGRYGVILGTCVVCRKAGVSPDEDCPVEELCTDCLAATGGECRAHQQPECTCYEASPGHMPGCGFYRG